jgi:hypothetical protein
MDSQERSVGEDQFFVACEGKLMVSPDAKSKLFGV